MKIAGIYAIKNLINGKVYVGSSLNIRLRWTQHKQKLRRNQHHSSKLQKEWKCYGEQSFVFFVVEEMPGVRGKALVQREAQYIENYKSYEQGYNCTNQSLPYSSTYHEARKKENQAWVDEQVRLDSLFPEEEFWGDDEG